MATNKVETKFVADVNQMLADLKKVQKQMNRVAASARKVGTAGTDAGNKVDQGAKKGKKGLDGMMVSLLRTRAGFVVLGLIAKQAFDIIIGKALRSHREAKKLGGQVDRLAAEIRTITGERGSRLPLIGQLMELSNQFGQTYETMAKAKYDIVSGGFTDAADSAKLLEISSKAAVAGVADVGTTAKVLVQSLRAYGAAADDAEDFADTLFTTIRLGITTMPELASSIGRVTPIAKIAGLSFEELGAAMAILTAKGLKTTEAATSLRALLKALISPSSDTGKALADLGVNMDAGFTNAMIRLGEAGYKGEAVLAQLFNNIRAQMGVFGLAADNAQLLIDTMGEMDENTGDMQTAFGEVSNTIDQFNKKQEQAIANYNKIKALGAGAGAEVSYKIVSDGLDKLAADAYASGVVLSRLKSTAEATATVLTKKTELALDRAAALLILRRRVAQEMLEENEDNQPIRLGSAQYRHEPIPVNEYELKIRTQQRYNDLIEQAIADFDKLKIEQDENKKSSADLLKTQDAEEAIAAIDKFNEAWADATKGPEAYRKAFNQMLDEIKFDEAIAKMEAQKKNLLDIPDVNLDDMIDVQGLKAQNALIREHNEELDKSIAKKNEIWKAIVGTGETLPSDELVKSLVQNLTDANNETVIKAAKALGLDMSVAIWDGASLSERGVGASDLSDEMVSMITNALEDWDEAAIPEADKITLGDFIELSKTGNWASIKTLLDSMATQIEDFNTKLKSDKAEGRVFASIIKEADELQVKLNLLNETDYSITSIGDISKLKLQMEGLATAAGITQEKMDGWYDAFVRSNVEAENQEQVLQALKYIYEELGVAMREAGDNADDTALDWEEAGDQMKNAVAGRLSGAMASVIEGTQSMSEAFNNMARKILADLSRVIIKMLIIRAIEAAFGMSKGGTVTSGDFFGPPSPFALGGMIPRAAAGMMIPSTGQAGLDSVLIAGMPGEGVIKRNTMQRLERFLASSESASAVGVQSLGGSGAPMQVNFNIARPQSASDSVGMARTVSRMTREHNRRVM